MKIVPEKIVPEIPPEIVSQAPKIPVAVGVGQAIRLRRSWSRWLWVLPVVGVLVASPLLRPLLPSVSRSTAGESIASLTTPVTAATLAVRIEGSGSVVSIDMVNLSPKTTGRLVALYVAPGDRVKAGQILAQMDRGSLQAEFERAQAQLAQAEADYTRIQAGNRQESIRRVQSQVAAAQNQRDLAASRLGRFRALATEGAISENDLDQYTSEVRAADASLSEAQAQLAELSNGSRPEEIASASAQVDAARAAIDIITTQIEEASIRAPFDGLVTQVYASIGAIVTPTTTASTTASATSSSILALSSGLEVEVNVAEANIGLVGVDQSVEIVADAFPNQVFKGKVVQIAPEAVVENNVTTFQVTVRLLSGLDKLRSGMTVDATFIGQSIANALMVPTVAIATQDGQMGVHIPDAQGGSRFQPVVVGLTQAGQTQIVSGLQAGDRVFLDLPQPNAKPGLALPQP